MDKLAKSDRCEHLSGIVVEARIVPRRCAAGRIIASKSFLVRRLDPASIQITGDAADTTHFAFYEERLLTSGKQPYDYMGAEYIPLPFSALRLRPIAGYGALLIQNTIESGAIDTVLVHDGLVSFVRFARDEDEVRVILRELAQRAGVPPRTAALIAAA